MLIVVGETFSIALENLVFLQNICLKTGDTMVTNLERFKAEMELQDNCMPKKSEALPKNTMP